MTVEEGIRLAKQGDVQQMMALAYYYGDANGDHTDYQEAAKWADRAAAADNIDGIVYATIIHSILGEIYISENFCSWKEALSEWQSVYQLAQKALGKGPLDEEEESVLRKNILDSLYCLSFLHYKLGNYSESLNWINGLQNTSAQLLQGLCFYEIAVKDIALRKLDSESLNKSFTLLQSIELDYAYMQGEKSRFIEEYTLAMSALNLSMQYRAGHIGIREPNLDKAVAILSTTIPAIRNESLKTVLNNDLARYKKRLLGGYKYI